MRAISLNCERRGRSVWFLGATSREMFLNATLEKLPAAVVWTRYQSTVAVFNVLLELRHLPYPASISGKDSLADSGIIATYLLATKAMRTLLQHLVAACFVVKQFSRRDVHGAMPTLFERFE
jgi:hypothetical protein